MFRVFANLNICMMITCCFTIDAPFFAAFEFIHLREPFVRQESRITKRCIYMKSHEVDQKVKHILNEISFKFSFTQSFPTRISKRPSRISYITLSIILSLDTARQSDASLTTNCKHVVLYP